MLCCSNNDWTVTLEHIFPVVHLVDFVLFAIEKNHGEPMLGLYDEYNNQYTFMFKLR